MPAEEMVDAMRRALRHVSDEHVLQMLRSPHPPFEQAPVVAMLCPAAATSSYVRSSKAS